MDQVNQAVIRLSFMSSNKQDLEPKGKETRIIRHLRLIAQGSKTNISSHTETQRFVKNEAEFELGNRMSSVEERF